MKNLYYSILTMLHKMYCKTITKENLHITPKDIGIDAQTTSNIIYKLLMNNNPCMICRFGSTELSTIAVYKEALSENHDPIKYIKGDIPAWWLTKHQAEHIQTYSGFFPATEEYVTKFTQLMLNDTKYIDILGSWFSYEKFLNNELKDTIKVPLMYLEPFWAEEPWTKALEDKNVLVVHPFAKQIKIQYENNRNYLFRNKNILPEFKLEVISAVQSLGGSCNFNNWFDALKWMEDEIDKINFDVCLIGCGAYGLPLAAHVKRQGKKAIHLAGSLQLLFGIIGNRWANPNYGVKEWGIPAGTYSNLINKYWIKPGLEYKPINADKIEGACYW